MWTKNVLRFRECAPTGALPGWYLRCVARTQGRAGQTFIRKPHPYTSLEFIEAGSGKLTIDGQTHHLSAGDTFILPQGTDTQIVCDDLEPWRVLFLDCAGDLPLQLITAYGLEGIHIYPGVTIAQPLRNLLNFVGDDTDLQIRAGQTIQEILALLYKAVRRSPDWPDFVVKAKAFIDSNLESSFRLADVAAFVNCSEAHLSRSFRHHVGTPPGEYLISRRMDLAKALLDSTEDSVKTIAERLSYHDSFAFSHAFKALVGIAPSKWRDIQRAD